MKLPLDVPKRFGRYKGGNQNNKKNNHLQGTPDTALTLLVPLAEESGFRIVKQLLNRTFEHIRCSEEKKLLNLSALLIVHIKYFNTLS